MKDWMKALIITLVFGAITYSLTGIIWPPEKAYVQPVGLQIPFFILVSIFESLLFGLGIAFFVVMWPVFRKAWDMRHWPTVLSILALTWMFLNWWPHDNMHLYFGPKMETLVFVEGFFHGSMILSLLIVAGSYYLAVRGEPE